MQSKPLRDILAEEGEGYRANPDPKMLPREPNGEARFVEKHLKAADKRITDIDPSTLDDDLFKGNNIKRAVPEPETGERHGHVPTGKDAAVYESLFEKIGLAKKREQKRRRMRDDV